MRFASLRRSLVLGVAAIGLFGSSACFGSFQLTRKLYQFNKGVGDKWTVEIVFLALGFVQVYSVVALADAVVFNSVEFWTGENPVNSMALTTTEDGTQLRQTRIVDGNDRVMRIEEVKEGALRSTTTLRLDKTAEQVSIETKFADGRVDSRVVTRAQLEAMAAGQ